MATEQLELLRTTTSSPPKVATLQERITQLRLADSSLTAVSKGPPPPAVKESMGLVLQKDRFGYPVAAEPSKSPLRAENAATAATGPVARRASGSGGVTTITLAELPPPPPFPRGHTQQRREVFMRQVSSPDMSVKPFVLMTEAESPGESSLAPPPPPPRATMPGGFSTLGRRQPPSKYQVAFTD